jgi:hypothetical protein
MAPRARARLPKPASRRRAGPREPPARTTAKCRQQACLLRPPSPQPPPTPPPPRPSRGAGDQLLVGQYLSPSSSIVNSIKRDDVRLVYQTDGNLVTYKGQSVLWATNTASNTVNGECTTNAMLTLQSDGNLVLYGCHSVPIWSSVTVGRGATKLVMQGDCNLVLYNGQNQAVWASNTTCPSASRDPYMAWLSCTLPPLLCTFDYMACLCSCHRDLLMHLSESGQQWP